MIKREIQYKNFDNEEVTRTLWFHLTESQIIDNLDLEDKLQTIVKIVQKEGEATLKEKQFILKVIKRFIRISYGERDPQDPDYFGQSENISERFMNTAAYNAFLLSLFDPPENAMEFLTHILPDGLRARAQEQLPIPEVEESAVVDKSPADLEQIRQALAEKKDPDPEQPLYIRENRAATQGEVQNMSREELLQAMAFRQTLGQ